MSFKGLESIKSPKELKFLPKEELLNAASAIREKIIDVVSKNGGHLATNLGIVELTIALHYVFDCPSDKIVWDVGHQAYAHKILTGRLDKFDTLRQYKGISGFPNRFESEYDSFTTGHSSTSISQALSLAVARDLSGEKHKVLAVIGDGSLSGGMAFEALNNAGQSKKDLIVVVNDNEMAIAKNVGALSDYLNRIITTPIYKKVRTEIRDFIKKLPGSFSDRVLYTTEKIEESLKGLLVPGMLFEELGFFYIGPINGHDIKSLINTFQNIKNFDSPVLIHVITKKGKGYLPAEENPTAFHGTGPFKKEDGSLIAKDIKKKSFTNVFTETVENLGEKDKKVVAITAAMPLGVGLSGFASQFPERFFDVGIAEQHAVTFAGGLAIAGYKPIVAIYSTFFQRAYDQIIHDVCLQEVSVIFALDRVGLVGEDGATHHGVFTVSFLRSIPNLIIAFPKDGNELKEMFQLAHGFNLSTAVCYPKANIEDEKFSCFEKSKVEIGKSEYLVKGEDIVLFALGSIVSSAMDVVSFLRDNGVSAGLVNVRFVKPFDKELLEEIVKNVKNIVIIEEGVLKGGLGSLVMETLEELGVYDVKVKRIGIPDKFIEHGKREKLLKELGLDKEGILKVVKKMVDL